MGGKRAGNLEAALIRRIVGNNDIGEDSGEDSGEDGIKIRHLLSINELILYTNTKNIINENYKE
jgi:hypothetical protein